MRIDDQYLIDDDLKVKTRSSSTYIIDRVAALRSADIITLVLRRCVDDVRVGSGGARGALYSR